jgi:hypothetical protein
VTATEAQVNWGTCTFSGHNHPAERRWNGQPICWAAWNRIKLDLPAARHWAEAVEKFKSGVDIYDLMTFWPKRCGLDQEDMHALSAILDKIAQGSQAIIDG